LGFFCRKKEKGKLPESPRFLKNKKKKFAPPPPHKKIVSFNFGRAVFSILDILTLEDGSDRLYRNVRKQLPLDAA